MELREHFFIIKKYWYILLIFVVVITGSALLFRKSQPVSYEASRALTIARGNLQQTDDYKYDNYYAIQASELFGRTVVGWLETPSLVLDIYNASGVATPSSDLNALSNKFKATRLAPQVIQVEFSESNPENARKVSDAVVTIMQREVEKVNAASQEDAYFTLQKTDTVVNEKSKQYPMVGLVSFLVGLFLGYNALLLVHYIKKHEKA